MIIIIIIIIIIVIIINPLLSALPPQCCHCSGGAAEQQGHSTTARATSADAKCIQVSNAPAASAAKMTNSPFCRQRVDVNNPYVSIAMHFYNVITVTT